MLKPPAVCGNPYWEVECYLRKAEDEISKSFHELAGVGLADNEPNVKHLRRGSVEAVGRVRVDQQHHHLISQQHNLPAVRRKRLTRRHKRANTVELFTPREDDTTTDDDRDNQQPPAHPPPPAKLKPKPKGPAARKVHRWHASATRPMPVNGTQTSSPSSLLGFNALQQRSMSVRELPGVHSQSSSFDFANRDSVTRWTSQILAEIESLPSSRLDLCIAESPEDHDCSEKPPPIPPHRDHRKDSTSTMATTMTTSSMSERLDEACVELMSVVDMAESTNSLASTLRDSRTPTPPTTANESDDDDGDETERGGLANGQEEESSGSTSDSQDRTPIPSPTPSSNTLPPPPSDANAAGRMVDRPLTIAADGIARLRKSAAEQTIAQLSRSLDESAFPSTKRADVVSPLTIWKRRQAESRCQRQQQPGDPPLSTPLRPPQPPPRRSVRGVVASLIKAAEETHQRAAPLPPPPIPPRVHHIEVNVVAVNGEQQQIVEHLVPQEQQHQSVPSSARSRCSALLDAGTQTSPFSLSRSSSFDWICDPDEEVAMRSAAALRPPHAIDSCSTTSSSTTSGDEALRLLLAAHADDRCTSDEDVEVSETLMRERHIHQHHHRRLFAAEPNGADDVRQREIDDSIAMLLEYSRALGGPAPQLLPPPLASTMSAIGAADEGRLLRGKFDSPTFGDVDRRLRAEASGMPVPRERPSKQHRRTTADGQQSPATTAIPLMNDSLYDNVPELRRHLLVSHQLMQPTVDIWDTENDSIGVLAALSPGEASSAEEFDSTIPRDFSVGSGLLADSESSPLSPENGHIFRSNGEDSALLLTSPDSKSSGDDEQRLHHSVRSPPPPSPLHQRLSTAAIGLMLTPSLDRAGSVDQLDKDNPLASSSQGGGGSDSGFSSSKEKAEVEATECCKWLRAAGFPQYAQMYEDQCFPIDVQSVHRDHEFLDQDSLGALFRRLHALNRCAIMKIDNVVLRRNHMDRDDDDSEDEDHVAISRRWRYQRKSQTWSRIVEGYGDTNNMTVVDVGADNDATTVLDRDGWSRPTNFSQPSGSSSTGTSSSADQQLRRPASQTSGGANLRPLGEHLVHEIAIGRTPADAATSSSTENIMLQQTDRSSTRRLQRSQSERIKDRAKAIMKRMDIRSSSRRRKTTERHLDRDNLVIGEPVLVSHYSASPQMMRMLKVQPGEAAMAASTASSTSSSSTAAVGDAATARTNATNDSRAAIRERRQGMVVVSPDSPDSPNGYRFDYDAGKCATLDANSNLHKSNAGVTSAFAPKTTSLIRTGIRTNAHVAPAPSPLLARRQQQQLTSSDHAITVYNQSYSSSPHISPLTARRPLSNGQQRPDRSDLLDSSPEMPTRLGVGGGGGGRSLRVHVDQDLSSSRTPSSSSMKQPPTTGSTAAQRSHSSLDSSDTDSPRCFEMPERRDSGVGSSLSRSPSGPTKHQQQKAAMSTSTASNGTSSSGGRWQMKARGSAEYDPLMTLGTDGAIEATDGTGPSMHMDALSLPQLVKLRKFAYLKLTALLERYSPKTGGGAHGRSWGGGVHKLIKKIKSPDTKGGKDRQLFGVSLATVAQRTGMALPTCVLHAMHFLRQQAPDTVGLFRKNGVRSRIVELRQRCEQCGPSTDGHSTPLPPFDPNQVHDVADLLKQYFRDLPEPLMTQKMSDTFTAIHLYVPAEFRLEAMQNAVLLLPDENREALQTLLYFLRDIAHFSDTNRMTAQNLAVCFSPSLFQLSPRLSAISPTRRHKTIGAAGMPNEKEMRESQAAQACLSQMILECRRLFLVPKSVYERYYIESGILTELFDPPTLNDLGAPEGNYRTYLLQRCKDLLKEHRDRWKGWMTEGSSDGVEISSKKATDGHPLKYWRVWTDVEAPPRELLMRILRERPVWDEATINWRVLASINDNCEVFQYVVNDTPPHPTRDCVVVRLWRTELSELRGGCVLSECSVASSETQLLGGVRAVVLASRFLIEPSGAGRSRITYVARVDLRGRSGGWYAKVFSHSIARQMGRLRDSFRQVADDGPETKV